MTDSEPTGVFSRLMASEPRVQTRSPQEATPPAPPAEEHAPADGVQRSAAKGDGLGTHAATRARTHARTSVPAAAETTPQPLVDGLRHQLRTKQHLVSSTFRFRADQLEALDKLARELEADHPNVSKNDLVRLALAWLLADYQDKGEVSTLTRVLLRM